MKNENIKTCLLSYLKVTQWWIPVGGVEILLVTS